MASLLAQFEVEVLELPCFGGDGGEGTGVLTSRCARLTSGWKVHHRLDSAAGLLDRFQELNDIVEEIVAEYHHLLGEVLAQRKQTAFSIVPTSAVRCRLEADTPVEEAMATYQVSGLSFFSNGSRLFMMREMPNL